MRSGGGYGWHHRLGRDPDAVAGKTVDRTVLRRVFTFAGPYRWMLGAFLGTILAGSIVGILPPLVFRSLIDHHAIPRADAGGANRLALIALALAFGDAGLNILQRWWGARIAEGVIFDLRCALHDHVQRMPLAFFTRTQTGSLISRMNNDVMGAQQAFTGTLGSVVQNVLEVVTLFVMIQGRIVERGTHDKLVDAGGLYSELYATQYAH
ncbi:MAG TPA: ABC transporter transmembrane domain-containing protein [Acidimicrobiales bacterium]|nr:ABC transporter transmembrane domain-containing protein [Acidimicrobiales bacterium]